MSMVGKSTAKMATPFFGEFKKQASFYLKEKLKTARLALTDVTPTELLTEEATNANPCPPDTKTMSMISRAAFEVDDYWRVVDILHKKLETFDRTNWRVSYKALLLLEHLLTHGPESVAEEFQSDRDAIEKMESFQYIDERGFNWGLTVRRKSERVLILLERGPVLKEERDRSRKISRGIQGFGSFCNRSEIDTEKTSTNFGRSNSIFNHREEEQEAQSGSNLIVNLEKSKFQTSFKENLIPAQKIFGGKLNESEFMKELNPKNESKSINSIEEDHPFENSQENHSTASLLST